MTMVDVKLVNLHFLFDAQFSFEIVSVHHHLIDLVDAQ